VSRGDTLVDARTLNRATATPGFVRAPADFECHSRRLACLIAWRNRRKPVWTWKYRSVSMQWERGLRAPSTVPECLKE
jgi:hypothetical protein